MMQIQKDMEKRIPDQEEEQKKEIKALGKKLEKQQLAVKEKRLPVFVLLEGWGAAGKGSLIRKIIRNMDPRFFKVVVLETESTDLEQRMPFLYRYMRQLPENGSFAFLDSGWMEQIMGQTLAGEMTPEEYQSRIHSIKTFERQIVDNGYLVLKFFLSISQEEQKKRLRKLEEDANTCWRVSEFDRWQNKNYHRYEKAVQAFMKQTHTDRAPWYFVDAENGKKAEIEILTILTQSIDRALQHQTDEAQVLKNTFSVQPIPRLAQIPLEKSISAEKYKKKLKKLQSRLSELHNILYLKKVPVVIVYEGWDAAGKGGNIKRVADALDPRGYDVVPIASPEPHEKNRFYLWRFWTKLQRSGHVTIFDRSWYGRVMVERIEGFCSDSDWRRAYREINEFEKELTDWGAVIVKFWIQIDKDTQLQRFEERKNTPEKQWKITEEDWRNREKWPEYEQAVDEMLQKTNTPQAPWHIVESKDKKYARIKALEIIIGAIEAQLKKQTDLFSNS